MREKYEQISSFNHRFEFAFNFNFSVCVFFGLIVLLQDIKVNHRASHSVINTRIISM